MYQLLLAILLLLSGEHLSNEGKWGKTGHRVVGEVAASYITPATEKEINLVLGHQSLAIASTWMDQIKSDSTYDYTHDWHWVTIPSGMTYEETEKNPNGDLIQTIQTLVKDLKKGELSPKEEEKKLKMLIHLVGDIHQPLHVGTGEDMGGNDTRVEWFYEPSNLHRVWDSEMVDDTQLSYTEFAHAINHPSAQQIRNWQESNVIDWAKEAMELRDQVYDVPDDRQLSYEYQYKNSKLLNRQLLKGGVRLGGLLNEIYGSH